MRICFTMTVFNGDYVLKQALESVYEFADQILISEGVVEHYRYQGHTTSTDRTNDILHSFPDPQNKIKILHGQYKEKDEQQNAVNPYIKECDWMWFLACDEVFLKKDINVLLKTLEGSTYTGVGFKPYCFYGGLDSVAGGYDEIFDQIRMFKAYKGTKWSTHRSLNVQHAKGIKVLPDNHLSNIETGKFMRMYHYCYTFPKQMQMKSDYYENSKLGDKGWMIKDYFKEVYLRWVNGNDEVKKQVEDKYNGVHPFISERRPASRTYRFNDKHPESIEKDISNLKQIFKTELDDINRKV